MDDRDTVTLEPLERRLPEGAPVFLCPSCECPLEYAGSRPGHGGGHLIDLSDYYTCPAGCGTFEHERRAHRFRVLEAGYRSS
jgi:hypothetical protein